jgi:DNA-binding FadR family transcriptional regulator
VKKIADRFAAISTAIGRDENAVNRSTPPNKLDHLDVFQQEHEQILDAIRERAVTQARAAMQRHLVNSRGRYEKLAAEIGIK